MSRPSCLVRKNCRATNSSKKQRRACGHQRLILVRRIRATGAWVLTVPHSFIPCRLVGRRTEIRDPGVPEQARMAGSGQGKGPTRRRVLFLPLLPLKRNVSFLLPLKFFFCGRENILGFACVLVRLAQAGTQRSLGWLWSDSTWSAGKARSLRSGLMACQGQTARDQLHRDSGPGGTRSSAACSPLVETWKRPT